MARIDLTMSSSSDEDDDVCIGTGVELKVKLMESPTSSPDQKMKRLVSRRTSGNKLEYNLL